MLKFLKRDHTKPALFLVVAFLVLLSASSTSTDAPAVGTKESVGQINGVEIVVEVQSPASQDTPLQIVCLFEYTEGDIFTSPPALPRDLNGMVHVDEALKGLITDLRKSKKFEGKALETLLISPPENSLLAKKLLLIGLGDRNAFKPEVMRMVGVVGMREALRLGVSSYSHASDLKDAGLSSPTAEVAGNVVQGAIEAYQTQKYLVDRKASAPLTVTKITLLAGPAYFADSKEGIKKTLATQSEATTK